MMGAMMQQALEQARQAFRQDEVPVGCVIVEASSGRVISQAHNRMRACIDPTAHAELNAIRQALQKQKTPYLDHADIYVTLEPCAMCAAAISWARLRRLYFGAYDPKGGGVDHGARIYEAPNCRHVPHVYGGICEEECATLLREFFKDKRGTITAKS